MTFRTLLMIGSALALAQPAIAGQTEPPVLLAQAAPLPRLEAEARRAMRAAESAREKAAETANAARAAEERAATLAQSGDAAAADAAVRKARQAAKAADAARTEAEQAAARAEEAAAALRAAEAGRAEGPAGSQDARGQRRREREPAPQAESEPAPQAQEEDGQSRAERREELRRGRENRREESRQAKRAEEQRREELRKEEVQQREQEQRAEERRKAAEQQREQEQRAQNQRREELRKQERQRAEELRKEEAQRREQEQRAEEKRREEAGRAHEERRDEARRGDEQRRQEVRRERERRAEQRRRESEQQERTGAPSDTTVEQQIGVQGSREEVRNLRRLREKLERERVRAEEQQEPAGVRTPEAAPRHAERPGSRETRRDGGQARDDRRWEGRGEVVERRGDRVIVRLGDRLVIAPEREGDRLLSRARDVEVENLGNGQTRTTVFRDDGVRIVTVRDRWGDMITRTRILPNGRRFVLIDNRRVDEAQRGFRIDIGRLPPLVIGIPEDEYIVETGRASRRQVEEALVAPPVEEVERAYTLDEVRYSERLRDTMRRVDLDTITFEFGSAVVGLDQLDALDGVGLALEGLIARNPDEVFLIEGHTDAVGSNEANLLLSDRRAEAVAVALSEDFDIPPENLVTQGYGEEHLKIATASPERENRRVAVRRITPLLRAER